MVNRTFWKTCVRSVRSSFSRFFAIFAIVALGCGFLAGLGHGGEGGIVGNDDDGLAGGAAGILQQLQDALAGDIIQRAGGLVTEQELGVFRQRPGDGHPLLLSAGKLIGIGVGLVGQTDLFQQGPRLLLRLLPVPPQHMDLRIREVFQNGEMGKQVEALEHQPEAGPRPLQLCPGGIAHPALPIGIRHGPAQIAQASAGDLGK